MVGRILESRFAPGQAPTSIAVDCAGRLITANDVTGQVLRTATSTAVCRWLPTGTTGPVTITITGLARAHRYHYRVQVTNGSGTVYGSDRSATTG